MSNINFYTKKDITDSLIKDSNGFKLPTTIVESFITEVNNEYEALCNIKGAYDDDILINDVTTEIDERNPLMVKLCDWNFLSKALFALSKEKDDVYLIKYAIAVKEYEKALNYVSYQTVVGDDPIAQKTSGFRSIPIGRA